MSTRWLLIFFSLLHSFLLAEEFSIEKIKNMPANSFLSLGSPKADEKWGGARGRTWSASMVHAYELLSYDIKRGLFMLMPCPGVYWRNTLKNRAALHEEAAKESWSNYHCHQVLWFAKKDSPWKWVSPYMYHLSEQKWARKACTTKGPNPRFGVSFYIPSMDKTIYFGAKDKVAYLYDVDTNEWSSKELTGPLPPFGFEPCATFDEKRNRIYLGGGAGTKAKETFWILDVNEWKYTDPQSKGVVGDGSGHYSCNMAKMFYDSKNDLVVLNVFRPKDRSAAGIYVYHIEKNEWVKQEVELPKWKTAVNGFYDPINGVHYYSTAGDSQDNSEMYVYKYK